MSTDLSGTLALQVAKELKETIAELQLAFETTLQVKEEVIMPVAEKIDVAAALSLLDGKVRLDPPNSFHHL